MNNNARFECATSLLRLSSLISKTRGTLCVCVAIGMTAHLSLLGVRGVEAERKAARPLTTRFVKRQPRLSKPLELKKRPRPKRRQIQRTMVSVKAHARGKQIPGRTRSVQVLGSLARPRVQMRRALARLAQTWEPKAAAQAIQQAKESQHTLDTSLEMMDVESLDTGRYQAMVIQDPTEKRNIKGYLHLAIAYPLSVRNRHSHRNDERILDGLRRLITRMNDWTNIRAELGEHVTFDSAEFFKTPWVYLHTIFGMDPTEGEVVNLGRYMLRGGFFFFEGRNWREYRSELSLMRFVDAALGSQGYRRGVAWEYEVLPNSHPVFHCYYDFPDGPPMGAEAVWASRYWPREGGVDPWCRGVELDGRILAFHTNQVYGNAWADWGHTTIFSGNSYAMFDPTVQFRFGINTIIFALTQEGSITHRLMDSIR